MGQKKYLVDHRLLAQRRMNSALRNRRIIDAYGDFLGEMRPWAWFVTITFRDQIGKQRARDAVEKFLQELQAAAGNLIAWVMAEDCGKVGGRRHFHLLIEGVEHLSRKLWWRVARERFGRAQIKPFDKSLGGAYYLAQNGLAEKGDFHFGGTLSKAAIKKTPGPAVGGIDVARSADVPTEFFHMTLGRKRQR